MNDSDPEPEVSDEKTDAAPQTEAKHAPVAPTIENRDYFEVLRSLAGKVLTIANPESFEETNFGHTIEAGWYKGKLVGWGKDYIILITEFVHGSGKKAMKEMVKQYIPMDRIKRISLMKTQRLIHL